jgi:hypothetical protein
MRYDIDSYEKAADILRTVLVMRDNEAVKYEEIVGYVQDALITARNYGCRCGYSKAGDNLNEDKFKGFDILSEEFSYLPEIAQWVYKTWYTLLEEEDIERSDEDWQELYIDYKSNYKLTRVSYFVNDLCKDAISLGFVIDPDKKEISRL